MHTYNKTTKVRYDNNHVRLNNGEYQRADGRYCYRWTASDGKRRSIYASTLNQLRFKESQIETDRKEGIREDQSCTTVNDVYELWKQTKRGLRDRTFKSYIYMYELYIMPGFGKKRIQQVLKSDVKILYNSLVEGRRLSLATLDNIHTVLHQVFQLAVDDYIIRGNPTDRMLTELKRAYGRSEQRKALTVDEEKLLFKTIYNDARYLPWYPMLYIMANTGMRVGELTGLRWTDVNFIKKEISVNHNLCYYNHRDERGCYYSITKPKTKAGIRTIPMTPSVVKAFQMQMEYNQLTGLKCLDHIDGYDDFIFFNRFGHVHSPHSINSAIHRMVKNINLEILDKHDPDDDVLLLPDFSCHILRHTFATRLCEQGVNIKAIQSIMGQSDIHTTMDIYINVTNDFKRTELERFDALLNKDSRTG